MADKEWEMQWNNEGKNGKSGKTNYRLEPAVRANVRCESDVGFNHLGFVVRREIDGIRHEAVSHIRLRNGETMLTRRG